MKKPGEYTGTPDDVLNRYDYLSGLQDTTGYSQREWKIIYAHSGVVMDVLLARHRGELPKYWQLTPEEREEKSRAVNSYREYARSERTMRREKLLAILKAKEAGIGVLVEALGKISQWKVEVDERKGKVKSIMNNTRGGVSELRGLYNNGNNDYSSQDKESIIMWIVHYTGVIKNLPRKANKYKDLCRDIVRELHAELDRRGSPMNIFEVNRHFIEIPQSRKDTFFNAITVTTGVEHSQINAKRF